MDKPERIFDHAFAPQGQDQLKDECAHEGCGRREIEHWWTVEAYEANPGETEVAQ